VAVNVFVKPIRLRAHLRRHPWIYRDSVDRIDGAYANGQPVVVRSNEGKFLAHAFVNDGSHLFLRLVSFKKKQPIDGELLAKRVRDAVRLRHDVLRLPERGDAYRLIHSEGDGIPGLVVDRYGDVLAVTCTSLGTHRLLEPILDELQAQLSPQAIVELEASPGLREREGLPESGGVLRGELPAEQVCTVDGQRTRVPLEGGQKTGLFLDQRDNVRRIAALAAGKRVLDACCYAGGFGIAAARAGAESVLAFDSSEDAVALAQANAELNDVSDRLEVRRASLFRELREQVDKKQSYDLIVLDPPKFAASAKDKKKASKGYLDANQLALRLLRPGGLLLTCSCSHHMDEVSFEKLLREAAARTGLDLRVLERRGAGPDHPTDLHCPEGRYLKGILIQRRS
jgi:23S rRNA (cytosine1962-C5)-methyltransferase